MGIFGPSKEELDKLQKEANKLAEEIAHVKVTTGDIKEDYEILKIIFQLGSDSGGGMGALFGTGGSPEAAFEQAEMNLKLKAHNLGCNYVINAKFDHRIAVGDAAFGVKNQIIEVFAYGTAVKTK